MPYQETKIKKVHLGPYIIVPVVRTFPDSVTMSPEHESTISFPTYPFFSHLPCLTLMSLTKAPFKQIKLCACRGRNLKPASATNNWSKCIEQCMPVAAKWAKSTVVQRWYFYPRRDYHSAHVWVVRSLAVLKTHLSDMTSFKSSWQPPLQQVGNQLSFGSVLLFLPSWWSHSHRAALFRCSGEPTMLYCLERWPGRSEWHRIKSLRFRSIVNREPKRKQPAPQWNWSSHHQRLVRWKEESSQTRCSHFWLQNKRSWKNKAFGHGGVYIIQAIP